MTESYIEQAAFTGTELPVNLTQPEQLFFLSLRTIYENYRQGRIDLNQSKREKQEVIQAYEQAKIWHNVSVEATNRKNRIGTLLSDITKNGCEYCRKAVNIFTGCE